MYTVSKILSEYLEENRLKPAGLARKLGYANLNKGTRRILDCLRNGTMTRFLLEQLVSEAGMDREALEQAIRDTQAEKEAEEKEAQERLERAERARFTPSLQALDRFNRSHLIGSIRYPFGRGKGQMLLPEDIAEKAQDEQLAIVKKLIRRYKARLKDRIPSAGKLTGFIYRFAYKQETVFTAGGEVTNVKPKEPAFFPRCVVISELPDRLITKLIGKKVQKTNKK